MDADNTHQANRMLAKNSSVHTKSLCFIYVLCVLFIYPWKAMKHKNWILLTLALVKKTRPSQMLTFVSPHPHLQY